jgi:hypothetical protein
MSSTEIKLTLHNWIDTIQDSAFLNAVYKFMSVKVRARKDEWKNYPPELKASIEKGLKELSEGKISSHEAVQKKLNSKYKGLSF